MKPQYIFLIFFALFITGLADGMEAGFAGLGSVPGVIPVVGTAVAAITGPVGLLTGIAVGWCINMTMGVGLLLLLAYNGMFTPSYWRFLFPGFIAETIPGLDALPFWTLVVVLCIMKKTAEDSTSVLGTVAKVAAAASLVGGSAATTLGAQKTLAAIRTMGQPANNTPQREAAPSRISLNLQSPGINTDIRYAPKAA